MAGLGHERYETELLAETARLGAAVAELEPQSAIPTCPEWTARDLVAHVGTGHRWVAELVEGQLQGPAPQVVLDAPAMPDGWPDWLAAGARRLVDAVRDGGPDRPVWTWQADRTVGFWLRRMLHDELVHRFDVELAAGRVGEVAPDLAADGVSDMLACIAMLSRRDVGHPVFGGLAGAGQTLRLSATDPGLTADGEWLVERTPDGISWRNGRAAADVVVRAPARELLLMVNRRIGPDRDGVEITGDRALFTHWLEHSKF